ncbi:contactin [Schistocerca gregaria]|uniref:contactin n=1 Tax=Schistocerca gregaria TaxID=7010 RepID=UPI00211DE962|nr:contactin [Schistocerca gregaria]
MAIMTVKFIFATLCLLFLATAQRMREQESCPRHWLSFQDSCYRFIKSPLRSRNDARRNCQAYDADLVSVSNLEEHGFLVHQLVMQDPQHRRWYTSARQQSPDYWVNDGDNSQVINMDAAFLPEQESTFNKDYLVYSFSNQLKRWGFEKVDGEEPLLFICEAPRASLSYLVVEDRTFTYGLEVEDPEKVPRGPFFKRQPHDVVFDLSKRTTLNDVTLSCLAGGYPTPTYEWFREDYENDRLVARKIDPLSDRRYTISGGALIIFDPKMIEDRASYHCKATNMFGTIMSESVQLSFGFIGEFNLKRSPETGNQNWGKTVFCDPPQFFPGVNYYWARDYFPNFVEEDKRVFVSYDGALYFSALENIDRGNYSCSVQSKVSDKGRTGPFFPLRVNPNSNYQQLKFPNNFPKAFPEAPVAGQDVRLECVAFGYPVPSYNWTRRGAHLPRGAVLSNYNRVLTIPRVQVEDQGEYVCHVHNDRASIDNGVILTIQAEPNFTIPLVDRHMDKNSDLTWTCEAFGIPDVTYSWLRNGEPLDVEKLPGEDRDRYRIVDNVLTIKNLDPDRDQAMYQCKAKNQLKAKYSTAQLRILSLKPSFKKRPLEPETYAAEGGNITINCNPEAAPRPSFVWKKDGSQIGSGGLREILRNGDLLIRSVSRNDEGLYTCIAENEYGVAESTGRLIVLRGPHFIQKMVPVAHTAVERDMELRCQAVAEEILDVAYIWTHNGLRIRDSDPSATRMHIKGNVLDIRNISFAEGGDYECIIKSAVGRIASKTHLIVEGPPGPPGGVQVTDIKKTSATIQWTDGATNGNPILHYTISGRTRWNNTWMNLSQNVEAKEVYLYNGRKEATVENVLSPWSGYEFRVSAANALGYGPPSAPSPIYNTPADVPYKAPSNVGGGGGKIGDLTITWDPLPPQDHNGPGIYYKIFWQRAHHDMEFQSLGLKKYGNIGTAVVRIQPEYYYTQFNVKVQSVNEVGYGPESKIVTIYSAEDMPQVAPQQVSARAFNSTALNVSWVPINQSREMIRGKLIGHRLKYWKEKNREEDAVYYLSRSTRPWAIVVGLEPDTYYYVKVMAYNSAGEGPESERFLERTYRKAPQKPPSTVQVFGVNPTTVKVLWRYVAPSAEEEPVIGFKVRIWEIDQDMSTANDTIVYVGSKLEAYVDNLSPGKIYHMRVLAFSNGGDGRMSSPALTFQMGDESLLNGSNVVAVKSSVLVIVFGFLLLLKPLEIV